MQVLDQSSTWKGLLLQVTAVSRVWPCIALNARARDIRRALTDLQPQDVCQGAFSTYHAISSTGRNSTVYVGSAGSIYLVVIPRVRIYEHVIAADDTARVQNFFQKRNKSLAHAMREHKAPCQQDTTNRIHADSRTSFFCSKVSVSGDTQQAP